jgi:hypothetical protein
MFGENLMTDPYQFMNVLEELENEFIDLLESLSENEISEIEGFLNEGVTSAGSPVKKALKNKSDKTGFPQGILTQVWKGICSLEKWTYSRNNASTMGNG